MSKVRILSLIIILVTLYGNQVFPQNYNDALRLTMPGLGSNARALGMGNAYHSLSDDASAAYFNPAGLALLKRLEFSGGIDYYKFNNNTSFFDDQTEYSNSQTQLNRISFAFPFPTMRGSLVFGLSYHRTTNLTTALKFDGFNAGSTSRIQDMATYSDIPYELYLADENNATIFNGRLNQSGSNLSDGSIGNWTLSGAIEAAQNFFIGANLNIITGSYDFNSDYFEDDERGIYQGITEPTDPATTDFQTFNINNLINWDLSGWDAKVGFIYQLKKVARFSAAIQFPKNFTVKEKFDLNAYSQFADLTIDMEPYSDEVEYDITTPYSFTGGFSLNYAGLIFSAEATYLDYSETEFSGAGNGLDQKYISDQNIVIKDLLTSAFNYNLGMEYTIPRVGLRLRGGYLTQPSPFKDDPSNFDRKYLTGGLGYLVDETIGIDLGYAYGWWDNFGDNYGSGVSRTNQEISINNFAFTLTYRF